MDKMLQQIKSIRIFTEIYIAVLLLSFHDLFIYFINSTYLSSYVGEKTVGLIYTIGSIFTIYVFLNASKILNRFGNFKTTIISTLVEMIALLGIGFAPFITSHAGLAMAIIILCFIMHSVSSSLLYLNLDIFIEKFSNDAQTGSIRGIYLLMTNIPPIITPVITGIILIKPDYWKVYSIAALFLVPFAIMIISSLKDFKDPTYSESKITDTARKFWANLDLRNIFIDTFLLNFFYAWMVIYTPIYLHTHIGFSLVEIGAMFSIVLLPFIIFQLPLGALADKKIGEKEILIAGFLIMAFSTIIIPNLQSADFFLWTLVLFITRIGASFVEVSCETYFFKKVDASEANHISFFRLTKSLPYLIGPVFVTIILLFSDMRYSFLVLGGIMLVGVRYAFMINDTR